jgi:hypothetical protein
VAGAPAAGKSTVSRLVAESRPRCVLVDVDHIRHSMVVSGAVLPSAEWPGQLVEQLVAAREAASGIARAYTRIGFDVVIDDFLDPFTLLSEYDSLADLAPTRVALVPTADVARERNLGRGTGVDFIDEGIDHFYGLLPDACDLDARGWTVLDTSTEGPEATRDRVLALS